VFLILLGVGVILDADWMWSGSLLIASGAWGLVLEARHSTSRERTPE
jgi:hypothetical protein